MSVSDRFVHVVPTALYRDPARERERIVYHRDSQGEHGWSRTRCGRTTWTKDGARMTTLSIEIARLIGRPCEACFR